MCNHTRFDADYCTVVHIIINLFYYVLKMFFKGNTGYNIVVIIYDNTLHPIFVSLGHGT